MNSQTKLIQKLSDAFGVSGFEDDIVTICRKELETIATISEDSLRNLYARIENPTENMPTLLIDAHSDEVGFIIQAVHNNGTLRFIPIGGWQTNVILGQKVMVRNSQGSLIPGVVGTKPPHFTSGTAPSELHVESLYIDVGSTSKQQTEQLYKIGIGAPAVPYVKCDYNKETSNFFGKAFDCRIGCAALIETLKQLAKESLQVQVVGAFSVQEEVGIRGAQVVSRTTKPDIAIIFEGAPADDTFAEEFLIQTALTKGPMLRHIDRSMITNPRFMRFAIDTAKTYGINLQESVRSGGGTDGSAVHLSNQGVPTIVISTPVRYIHSPHCICNFQDYEQAVRLAVAIAKALTPEIIASF